MRDNIGKAPARAVVSAAFGLSLLGAAAAGYGRLRTRRHGNSDDAPGRTARGVSGFGKYDVVGRSVTIGRPREEVFEFFRQFQNLPSFMENVVSIQPLEGGQWLWTIRAPAGKMLTVETRIVREVENELISWSSVEGSEIDAHGRVEFRDAPGERGTRVTAIIAYDPPAGVVGRSVAKLFLREPEIQARHDLKRLKMLLETGEIATSARRANQTRNAKIREA